MYSFFHSMLFFFSSIFFFIFLFLVLFFTSCVFFFSSRRRHTRWPRDWSSDVCSSDLTGYETLNLFLVISFMCQHPGMLPVVPAINPDRRLPVGSILEQVRHNRQGPREVVHVAGVTAAVVRWAGIPAIRAIEPQAYFQPITDLSGRIQTYVILFCTVVRTKNDSFLIQVTHG